MAQNKYSQSPPKPKNPQDFIDGGADMPAQSPQANDKKRTKQQSSQPKQGSQYPNPGGPSRNVFNLRLTDRDWAILEAISEKEGRSKQAVVKEALLPYLKKNS